MTRPGLGAGPSEKVLSSFDFCPLLICRKRPGKMQMQTFQDDDQRDIKKQKSSQANGYYNVKAILSVAMPGLVSTLQCSKEQ